MSKLLSLICISLLSACTINKLFYVPTKIPVTVKKMKMFDREAKDTTYVLFNEEHQPTFVNSENETKKMGYTVKSYNYKSTSGNMLNAWLIQPENMQPSATLLFLHGNAGNIMWQYPGLVALIKRGFQVFIFDYSGFGFSSGKPTRSNVLKDAKSSLDYVRTLPEVNSTKLIVYGQSLGGHLAAVLAEDEIGKVDALVIEGAFSSHKDIASETAGFIGRWVVKEKYSAVKSIKKYNKPLLVIHSTEDQTIPFYMGKRIYENANEPKSFYEIKKCHICGPYYYADSIAFKLNLLIR